MREAPIRSTTTQTHCLVCLGDSDSSLDSSLNPLLGKGISSADSVSFRNLGPWFSECGMLCVVTALAVRLLPAGLH